MYVYLSCLFFLKKFYFSNLNSCISFSYQGNIYILVLVILLCACHLSFFLHIFISVIVCHFSTSTLISVSCQVNISNFSSFLSLILSLNVSFKSNICFFITNVF